MRKFVVIVLLLCAAAAHAVHAGEQLSLTLTDAIMIALENNLSLKVEKLNAAIAEADILVQEGEFDPVIGLDASGVYALTQSPSLVESSEQRGSGFNTFIRGKIVTGTGYELKWTNEKFRGDSADLVINPYYTADLKLTLKQPLLRGFGISVQKAKIYEAVNVKKIADLGFGDAAEDIVLKTIEAYWTVVATQYRQEVAELSLQLVKKIRDEVKAKIRAGVLSPVERYSAEAEVAVREEELLKSRKDSLDSLDALRNIMNLSDWSLAIRIADAPPEPDPLPSLYASLDKAFELRRDYKGVLLEQKNKEILYGFHKNQRLPEVNLYGSVGLNGVDGTYSDAIDNLDSTDFYSWQAGIIVTFPLGNNLAGGNFLKAKHELAQSRQQLRELENRIRIEIRQGWRTLEFARKDIEAKAKTLRAARKRFEAEKERFRAGLATLNYVFEYERDYVESLVEAKESKILYAISSADFKKTQGLLLDTLAPSARE